MDFAKEKRKLKALSVLEKIKKFEKINALNEYQKTLNLKDELLRVDEQLRSLVDRTESDIQASIQNNLFRYAETLPHKQDFLGDLQLSIFKNSRHLSEANAKSVELLNLANYADAYQQLISEKYQNELSYYKEKIIEKEELN